MPPPSIPTVAPFTLARATDINAIATALQSYADFVAGSLNTLPLIVGARMITGSGGIADLSSSPADHVDVPLVFGFTGTLNTGDFVDIDTLSGVGAVGNPAAVGAKVVNGATGRIGFFDAATMSVPQVLNFNIEMNVPVHTTLQNLPPDAFRRQYNIGVDSNVLIDQRLDVLEENAATLLPNVVTVASANADYTTLGAAIAGIGSPSVPTAILIGPGTYTESPTVISGSVGVFPQGSVTLNYSTGSPGITVSGTASVTLFGLNVVNSGGPGISINASSGATSLQYMSVQGAPAVRVNTTQSVQVVGCSFSATSGGVGMVFSNNGQLRFIDTQIAGSSGTTVLDLGGSSPSIDILGGLMLRHQGVGGLNIDASASVSIKGGPIYLTDTTATISTNVTMGSSSSALLVPTISASVSATSTLAVVHNLGYKPIVQVIDSTSEVVAPDSIVHNSNSQFTVTWSAPFTGTILYR